MVDSVIENLQNEIVNLEKEVKFLENQERVISILKGEVKSLTQELQDFSAKYL